VAVLLAEVADVSAGGLEDPQAEQAQHGDQGEVVAVGGLAGGGEQGFELQVRELRHLTATAKPASHASCGIVSGHSSGGGLPGVDGRAL
jgi:hypothetical protein